MTTPISDDPADPSILLGTWSVYRKVVDHRNGGTLTFTGYADITKSAFDEYGELAIAGAKLDSRRHYALNIESEQVTVQFADGSPFIRLAAEECQRVVHCCGDDIYAGRFVIASPDRWAEIWSVRGPKKRYRSVTIYRRHSPASVDGDRSTIL